MLHHSDVMPIDSARAFFEALAARGREPRLADASGTWEFDIEGAGLWTVTVDRGALRVNKGRQSLPVEAGTPDKTRLRMAEDELLRLVRGDGHENIFMGLIRGAIVIEGELAFAQRLQAILPVPEEWGTVS
jgi:hypothetical protein